MVLLGVKIDNDLNNSIVENYTEKLKKLQLNLNLWSSRALSLLGKSLIVKSLGISQFVYIMSMLPSPPSRVFEEVNNKIFGFIWKNKRDRIKRQTLQANWEMGGCKISNIECLNKSLKLVWLKRLLEEDGPWSKIIKTKIKCKDLEYFLDCNWKIGDLPKGIKVHKFWLEVLMYWSELTFIEKVDDYHIILDMNLWFNNAIKRGNECVFYRKWYNAGIKKIGDIVDLKTYDTVKPKGFRKQV